MPSAALIALLDRTSFASHLHTASERRALYRDARTGSVTRVFPGCYVQTAYWSALNSHSRHCARAHLATFAYGDDLEFSHLTAAALWRLPIVGDWPVRVHVAGRRGSGVDASSTLYRHTLGLDADAVTIEGLRVSSLAVTVAQVAASQPFAVGVVIADAALRQHLATDLHSAAAAIPLHHGRARALAVASFADGRADRPGESLSRVSMRAARLPMPELQVEICGASGAKYVVDFYWAELRLIGEFDGAAKYRDPEFLRGRTPEQALADEKHREDDLRATARGMTRWGWKVANSPVLLAQQLRRAGLP